MNINKFFVVALFWVISSCDDMKVIVEKHTLETKLNLINKDIFDNSKTDSISISVVKNEFKEIVLDSIYYEDVKGIKKSIGFEYNIESGNFGVAKFIDKDSIKVINFYNQMDIATENLRPSFTLYYFTVDTKTIVVNTFYDTRSILK